MFRTKFDFSLICTSRNDSCGDLQPFHTHTHILDISGKSMPLRRWIFFMYILFTIHCLLNSKLDLISICMRNACCISSSLCMDWNSADCLPFPPSFNLKHKYICHTPPSPDRPLPLHSTLSLSLCFNWAPCHEGVLGSGGIAPHIFWPLH
jgi:hypothetical protein